MKKLLNALPKSVIVPLFIVGGVLAGLVGYTVYVSRAWSYLSDSPQACINCHVMIPYYQSWMHSSHARWANCNDCHVPHDNIFQKYLFKAKDGLRHSYVFTMREEPQVMRPILASNKVIMRNCVRCHNQLNTALIHIGLHDYEEALAGKGRICWDCHRNVSHTIVSNLNSAPNALVPVPASPVPTWLSKMMNSNNAK